MKAQKVTKGELLVAEPFMIDPHFKRSVVLVCEHEQEGSLGFILNKRLDMNISELVPDFPDFDSKVYFGGPVATDTVHYVHNVGGILDASKPVGKGVFWGGDFEKLKFLISSNLVHPRNIRFFVGYSGWTDDQLKEEMGYGSWLTTGLDANFIFKVQPHKLWQSVLENMGDSKSVIAQIKEPYSWN